MTRIAWAVCVLTLLFTLSVSGSARADDPPRDDHRTAWRGVFYGSIAAAVVGGGVFVFGTHQIDDAENQLCTGRHANDCGHPPPQDSAVVAKYNDQGWNGSTLTTVGELAIGAAGIIGVVAFYKGFIEKDPGGSRSSLVIAPLVSPTAGGATLRLQW